MSNGHVPFRLQGRTALVTGAAMGMGAAHAAALAAQGAFVAVCDVDHVRGAAVAATIGGCFHRLDVTEETNWASVVAAVSAEHGSITVLVNNAGIAPSGAVQDATTDDWDRTLAVNVTGAFLGTRAAVPGMRAAGGGVIVNISSAAGMSAVPGMAAYCTSKWAMRGLTKASALDLAPDGIRVASIHPGLVRTPMSAAVDHTAATRNQPIQRAADPEEIARLLVFVVTEATYSTGCEFVADGGTGAGRHGVSTEPPAASISSVESQ